MTQFDQVLQEVDGHCRERHIPMLGREKAQFLAELIEQVEPSLIVECGTAIGYSGLWIASRLQTIGKGRLITIEIDADRANEAKENFARAGLSERVDSRIGDAAEVLKVVNDGIDFLLLDNSFGAYYSSFRAIESRLLDGATVVADNVGIGASEMTDYLNLVRSRYESQTHWFEVDLPWVDRDAMEVTIYRKQR
ncbi:MAG: CmcI family methyltransferase [Candidatus Poribacteria bacterium]|nr:CmcI family methyltransferase [Candidatus Poribacteria bacterium]